MKRPPFHPLLFAWISIHLLVMISFISVKGQTTSYTVANHVEIKLKSKQGNFEFGADGMEGRFNNRLSRFEFMLPWNKVYPQKNTRDLRVFNAVFATDTAATENSAEGLRLYVYFPANMRNFTSFSNGRTLFLTGECFIGKTIYKMPVRVEIFYASPMLHYGLDFEIISNFAPIPVDAQQRIILKEVELTMRQGNMQVYFEQ
ncbi:hypothetical protein GXP67_27770 [Rhodocytophaga rosea]|uniref:YceI family protein n=1 Tax=Rhodocytophaga rosea TaxID=2704465 RepID=A0A6C0GRE6_9BACT|nr:hypothetical protein [Rhodocytophaga rosea]QHT70173.1 hypothetical protein GXP67_27770 [Rhodocytophaga rosea]